MADDGSALEIIKCLMPVLRATMGQVLFTLIVGTQWRIH